MINLILTTLPYALNLLSGILLACATYTINKSRKGHEEERKKALDQEKALSDGVQALLRESIVNGYNKWNDRGYCPIYAKESVKRVYEAYTALDGNGVAKELYEKVLKMPTDPEKKEGEEHD